MRLFISLPLFAYLLGAAMFIMWPRPGEESMLNIVILTLALPSNKVLVATISDALIIASILVLYVETFKATRTSNSSIIDHTLSLLVFIVFLMIFITTKAFGNMTFLIMTIASLMDVVMGFTVTISAAKRDFNFGG